MNTNQQPAENRELIRVIEAIKATIAEDLDVGLQLDEIDESAALTDGGLNLDSVVLVDLIGSIEARLGFQFDDSDLRMRSFANVRTLAEVILNRLQSV
jgi:acyl carrier protein